MCAQRFVLSIIIAGLQHSALLLWHCFWWNTGTQSSSNNISLWVDMLDTPFLLARLLWYGGKPFSLDFGVYQRKFLWGSSCNDLRVFVWHLEWTSSLNIQAGLEIRYEVILHKTDFPLYILSRELLGHHLWWYNSWYAVHGPHHV